MPTYSMQMNRQQSLSIIAAVSTRGLHLLKVQAETVKSDDFVAFLQTLKDKLMKQDKDALKNTILIFDNARAHQARITKERAREMDFRCSTSIPYTPELNACEYFIKAHKLLMRKEIRDLR